MLQNKKDELELILHKDDIDVAMISETLPKNLNKYLAKKIFFLKVTQQYRKTQVEVCALSIKKTLKRKSFLP